jgi:5'-phosphate synthase pdxT subunit
MRVGVLDIQGDVSEHLEMLKKINVEGVRVRYKRDLDSIDGLIIPGGESTVIGSIMKARHMDKYILDTNIPVMGTCAGLILISEKVGDKDGLIPILKISVSRNAYGTQRESFETDLKINDVGSFRGVFIRAPRIDEVREGIVLSYFNGKPVMVKDGKNIGLTFHPEIYGDERIHKLFVDGLD